MGIDHKMTPPPMFAQSPTPRPTDQQAAARGRAYGVAMELAGSIIGMALIGWLVDRWLGTSPRWTLILTALGAIGGFFNFFKKAMALNREQTAAMKAARRGAPDPAGSGRVGAGPDLFSREDAGEHDAEALDFELPPDLESALEKRVKRIQKGSSSDESR